MVVSPYCSGSFMNIDLLSFLLPFVDVSLKDKDGRTALSYAQSHRDDTMSSLLLSQVTTASEKKRLEKEAEQSLVSLPSTVVNSAQVWEHEHDFYEDYQHLLDQHEDKQKEENKNITHKEKVEQQIRPKPDTRVEGNLTVLEDEVLNRYFDVVMVKVKVTNSYYSMNLFYKMQILYDSDRKLFVLLTNWGRVGAIGQHQQTVFFDKASVVKEFHKIFKEKTKNVWSSLPHFEKKHRMYNLLRVSNRPRVKEIMRPFDFDDPKIAKSELPEKYQLLMRKLCDSKMYELAYDSFGVSKEHLPFGMLDRESLLKAKHLLEEVRSLLKKQRLNNYENNIKKRLQLAEEITSKSSHFYELVPLSMYMESLVPPFKEGTLQVAESLVQNLLDFEIVSKLLCGAQVKQKLTHPFDYCLRSLGVKMVYVDPQSEEAGIIHKYIRNSSKYKDFRLVENIFAVSRPEENDRFIELHNRRLLWHATKTENIISILHSGLKVGLSSAENTGSMFGNGIYFSDFFDKSLGYCGNHYMNKDRKSVFILLCEVSLGNMKRMYTASKVKKLASKFNSVKGSGRNAHVKDQDLVLNNGCLVPIGELRDKSGWSQVIQQNSEKKTVSSRISKVTHCDSLGRGLIGLSQKSKAKKRKTYHLKYNEFVVYNPRQVKIRYLIEINKDIVSI